MSRRRFLVAAQGLSNDQQSKFTEYTKSNGFGWWHWIDNFWLLTVFGHDEITTEVIRDALIDIAPGARSIVMEIVQDKDWSGNGVVGKEMFKWMRDTWAKD